MANEDLQQEIGAVLRQLEKYWGELDFSGVRSLWDPEETEPYYLPEESEALLVGWPEVEAYWERTKAAVNSMSMRTWGLKVRRLQDDLAVAVYDMHWGGDFDGYSRPIGGENRVTAIFRHTKHGWRFCHYVEAPMAPMVYLQRLYALDA